MLQNAFQAQQESIISLYQIVFKDFWKIDWLVTVREWVAKQAKTQNCSLSDFVLV